MKRDIAIIGMSGRFPKSKDIEEFWTNLIDEKELIHFFSDKELVEKGVDKKEINQENYIKAASFIENTNVFDYPFFKYTLDEARIMNPQTRMMHHLVWEALESAGCDIEMYTKKIGTFLGANKDLNWSLHASLTNDLNVDPLTKGKLSNPNFMASLIAYKLNFKGPCYFIDTACSTSLSTAHLACRSLLLNECGIAVVGGIRLLSSEDNGYRYVENSIMSKDGHNRSFDNDSSGTIGSDGAGVVILKRLEEAIKDNDNVYAVIKGSAMNNDGKSKAGYTMPSVEGQLECIKLAQKIAGVIPTDITYIEAHGTGTKIGDPIEIESLNIAFDNNTNHKCAVGTIKSNMGHADEAAGIMGLMKTALSINNKIIPASLHYKKSNTTINFDEGPFYVNHSSQKWVSENGKPLTAGVSSLGIGGTNVHMILQEAPQVEKRKIDTEYKLIRYSAQTETALENYEYKLLKYVESKDVDITDLSYTLQTGRKQFDFVKYVVVKEKEELITALKEGTIKTAMVKPKSNIVFMFSGQGSQYVNMGRKLYDTYSIFKEFLDDGFKNLQELNDIDYKAILFNDGDQTDKNINQTIYTQPLLFAFEYALAQLLIALGVKPTYMIGHSLGEYVAATISGVFTFKDALKVILKRAELMEKVPEGDMVSIGMSIDKIEKKIIKNVSIAAINAHDSFVISGTKSEINIVKKKLEEEGIMFTALKTSHAFHSEMMRDILKDFENELETVTLQKPEIPFISNITGQFITEKEATSVEYWSSHIVEAVKFEKGIKELIAINHSLFIEIGPGRTLTTFYKKSQDTSLSNDVVTTVRHPKEKIDDNKCFKDFLGKLWINDQDIHWDVYYGEKKPSTISIPTYAFDEYDVPSKVVIDESILKKESAKHTKKDISDGLYIPSWKYVPSDRSKKTIFSKAKQCLFFNDNSSFSKELLEQLVVDNRTVVEVVKGERFKIDKQGKITINPEELKDYDELIQHLETVDFNYEFILYGWELCQNNALEIQNNYSGYNQTFNNIIKIIKAFKLEEVTDQKKIIIMTDKNHQVIGSENLKDINQHTGTLLNVLTQESKNVYGTSIDFDFDCVTAKDISLVSQELDLPAKYNTVAYRNGRRWIQYYESVPTKKENYRASDIKKNGNYIITGVLGDMEYTLTSHLLQEYNANVVVLSDQALYKWSEKSKELYEKLKKLSGTIKISHVDISNYESFLLEIENIESQLKTIDGIIHMARNTDIAEVTLVADIMEDTIEKHFSSRVNGLINIDKIDKEKTLGFVKVISSLSSFLGGITYGAYASASAQMDNIVLQRNSANWSVLNLDRVHEEEPWIRQNEFLDAFHYSFIHKDINQIIISKRNLNTISNNIDNQTKTQSTIKINRKVLKAIYTSPTSETESEVISLFENIFGVTGLGIEDDFFELGGDSLKAVLLINKLKKEHDVLMTLEDIFSSKTIKSIAKQIEQHKWITNDMVSLKEVDSMVI